MPTVVSLTESQTTLTLPAGTVRTVRNVGPGGVVEITQASDRVLIPVGRGLRVGPASGALTARITGTTTGAVSLDGAVTSSSDPALWSGQ